MRVEFGGDAFGVIVSAVENIRGFDEIDADNEDRTVAKNPRRVAKETRRFMRFKIADGRAGKEAGARPLRGFRRRLKHSGEIGHHRINRKVRKVAAQPGRFLLKKIAGDIDRHIGFDACRGAQKNTRLGARTTAELDKDAAGRKKRHHLRRVLVQKFKFAAGRIIFRQVGDAFEQAP